MAGLLERVVRMEERQDGLIEDIDELKPMVAYVYETVFRWASWGMLLKSQAATAVKVVTITGVVVTIAVGLNTIGGI